MGLTAQQRFCQLQACNPPEPGHHSGCGGKQSSLPTRAAHPEAQTLCLTQGDQRLVVPPHHSPVQILLPTVQSLPLLLIEVH